MAHQRGGSEPTKRPLPDPEPAVRRDGRKVILTDCSGVRWRVVLAYRAPPNWALSTKVQSREWAGRLFIRQGDGAMRFYDTREHTRYHEHNHRDWTAQTLQAQLAMAANVDVASEVARRTDGASNHPPPVSSGHPTDSRRRK